MAAVKRIATAGLIMALAVPTIVYGAEKTEYSQPIKDTKNQQAGVFGCEKDTEEWAKEIILTASAIPDSGKTLPEVSFLWREDQSDTASTGKTYTVKENGIYTVTLQLPEGSGLTAEAIQVDVQNIDMTGPEIVSVTKDVFEWTSGPVKITVECEDYQEADETASDDVDKLSGDTAEGDTEDVTGEITERSKGSGLHPEGAYSFDGGKTWTTDNSVTVEENTTIDFVVRDALENTTKQSITVDNIDKAEPTVRVNIADGGVLYEGEGGSLTLSASASDLHSGLADQAYSWDGGVSWTSTSTHQVTSAGNYTVLVRDKAGNYTQATLTVSYAQRPGDNNGGAGNTGNNTYASANNGTVYYGVPAAPMAGTNDDNENRKSQESERETLETKKIESRESRNKTETEDKESESLKTPLISNGESSGFPIRWVLIVIAVAAVIIGGIVAAKLISDRPMAMGTKDDDDEEDMSKVYARVSEKENQTLKAAAAAAVTAEEVETTTEEAVSAEEPEATTAKAVNAEEPEVSAAAAATAAMTEMAATAVEEDVEVSGVAGDTIQLDTEVIEEAMAEADTVTVEIPTVELEAESESEPEAVPEPEAVSEPEAVPEPEPNPVVLEGAHSRLIYDPATGEYKYEFK